MDRGGKALTRVALPLALLVPAALLLTGCGARTAGADTVAANGNAEEFVASAGARTDGARTGTGSGTASGASASAAPRGKSDVELAELLLTEGDLPNHRVDGQSGDSPLVTVDRPECRALAYAAVGFLPSGKTGWARASVVAVSEELPVDASERLKKQAALDAANSTVTVVTLGSYAGKTAAGHLAELRAAAGACAGGYAATANGEPSVRVTKVTALPAPVGAGPGFDADEVLAYSVEAESAGEGYETELVVVRHGGTVANFFAARLSGQVELPAPVVEAQLAKLG
ncbi:hypothetical protein AB0P15_20520 [Streptomyces sp. NPDC087917]|uniref:hypothetical protein n=1 Tax=Streptomyces sp. NPDC087917 TaxID=3155060 RepID=UPI00343647FF